MRLGRELARSSVRKISSKFFAFLSCSIALRFVLCSQKTIRLTYTSAPRKVAYCALGSLNTLATDSKVQRGLLEHVLVPLNAHLFIHGDREIDRSAMAKDLIRVKITSHDIDLMQLKLQPKKLQLDTIRHRNYTDMSPSCLKDVWFNRGAQRVAPLFEHAKGCLKLIRQAEQELDISYDWVFFARSEVHYTHHLRKRARLFPSDANAVVGSTNGATTLNARVSLVPRHYAEKFTLFADHLLGLKCGGKPTSQLCDKPYTDECLHTWYHAVANGREIFSLNNNLEHSLRRRCGERRECAKIGKNICPPSNTSEFCCEVRRYYRLNT